MTKTKKQIIEETVEFYNFENRAITEIGGCAYKNDEGDKCAVGRCFVDNTPQDIFDFSDNIKILDEYLDEKYQCTIDAFMKEEYRGHSLEFWEDLQFFHDDELNFNKTGLSYFGKQNKEELLLKWV